MSVIVRFDDMEFICNSPHEAAELSRLLRMNRTPGPPQTAIDSDALSPDNPHRTVVEKRVYAGGGVAVPTTPDGRLMLFMKLLMQRSEGITKENVAKRLGLTSTKGIGPFMGFAKMRLGNLGFVLDDVIQRRRLPGGEVRWMAGVKILEAIEMLSGTNPDLFGGRR